MLNLLKKHQTQIIVFEQVLTDLEEREYVRKVFFIWYGSGSYGKSELSNLMKEVLSKRFTTSDSSIFIKNKYPSSGATPYIMSLMNKHMGTYAEGQSADTIEFNAASVKNLSGEETVIARNLNQNPVEYKLSIKLNFLTNFVPPTEAEKAMVRRLHYLFFTSIFSDNSDAKNKKSFKKG
jgi:phage/plasmid-associated DNA primase